jgi:hypothetical protein
LRSGCKGKSYQQQYYQQQLLPDFYTLFHHGAAMHGYMLKLLIVKRLPKLS